MLTAINEEIVKEESWPVRLFSKSVTKQRKLREILRLLGPAGDLSCLDIGSDNGVISYLLRRRGDDWKSADLDEQTIGLIRELVRTEVYRIDGGRTPFETDAFDRVVIVDFLEHIRDDAVFIQELHRILKPGGVLIVNTPHIKESLLRKFRLAIGQTDEKHGHLRPGYTLPGMTRLLGDSFTIEAHRTYSKFFTELIDTLIVFGVSLLKGGEKERSRKGQLVSGKDLKANESMFRMYSLIYPVVWVFSKLDDLLFFTSGYSLIVRARSNKAPST